MNTRVLVAVEQLRRKVPGGIGRYAAALLDQLAHFDHPSRPVTLLASRDASGAAVDPLARWGFPLRCSPLPGPLLTRAWDRGALWAPRGYDVVHAVSLAAPPVHQRPSATGRRPTLVVVVHDLAWRINPEATTPHGRRWHEAALQRALRRAGALVVPSTAVADVLTAGGVAPERLAIIELGADHLPPPDRPGADRLLEQLGVTGPFLLSAGTLEPRKNLRRLVAAFAAVRPSLPEPWPLVIVGPSGWGDGGLDLGGDDGSAPAGVSMAGLVTDEVLAALYERCRVFCYVPLSEGYGLPPLEAMTFGTPVVASTGVPSVDVGPAAPPVALRVDPVTVDAMAAALLAAATDEALRDRLSAAGRALAATRRWSRTARQHIDLWESVGR